ncbi:MAG: hypothetical protein WB445_04725 [Acinetobacter sp.]
MKLPILFDTRKRHPQPEQKQSIALFAVQGGAAKIKALLLFEAQGEAAKTKLCFCSKRKAELWSLKWTVLR